MKKVNLLLAILVVFTIPLLIISFSQNTVIKSEEVYSFYFNDSRAVDKIYTEYTANDMARKFSAFMKSWSPEEFKVEEDTGYDVESVFTEDEGYNMMRVKHVVDINFFIMIGSLLITAFIYFWLLHTDKKQVLRRSYLVSMLLTISGVIFTVRNFGTNAGRMMMAEKLEMLVLPEDSQLATVLSPEFMSMASGFFALICVLLFGILTYITLLITKPPRLFSDN